MRSYNSASQADSVYAFRPYGTVANRQQALAQAAPIGFNYLSYSFTTARRYLPAGVLALVYVSKVWA